MSVLRSVARCDGKTDCRDSTDELQCRVVETDPSYNKFLSPPSEQRLPVLTSVRLHGLSRLEPVLASYQAEFTVSLSWRDSRLQFDNLRAESSMNSIGPEETDQIWFPSFYFDNTRDKVRSLTDSKAVLRVLRQGEGQLSSKQDTENKLIFQGRENFIQYERFYSEELHCDFFLHWYPFDYQTCYIDIKPSSNNEVSLSEFNGIYVFISFSCQALCVADGRPVQVRGTSRSDGVQRQEDGAEDGGWRSEGGGGETREIVILNICLDRDTAETAQHGSHHIPAHHSHQYHRAHVKLLQERFL